MDTNTKILKWSFVLGAAYFACISIAHTFGVKIPGLYIYFNVPSHSYQDTIIAFLTFGWSSFFYIASIDPKQNPVAVRAALISGGIAIVGLTKINGFNNFGSLSPPVETWPFWVLTLCLAIYIGWLGIFYMKMRKSMRKK